MRRLEGKTALITGGAKGIGEAVARLFLAEGAQVMICDMSAKDGEPLVTELRKAGLPAAFFEGNVTVPADVEASMKKTVETFGKLDILVSNAGIVERDTLLEDMPEEVWHNVLNVNLKGCFLNCKYALPYLRETKGCIVSMASTSALVATKNDPAYCASKAGIAGLMRAIAADYADKGVRANCVAPTSCMTPLFEAYIHSFDEEEQKEKMKRLGGPGGRLCTPEEVAKSVLFLASPEASYVNGITLTVDGGYCIV